MTVFTTVFVEDAELLKVIDGGVVLDIFLLVDEDSEVPSEGVCRFDLDDIPPDCECECVAEPEIETVRGAVTELTTLGDSVLAPEEEPDPLGKEAVGLPEGVPVIETESSDVAD